LSSKYFLVKGIFGWHAAKNVAISLRKVRWATKKLLDRALFSFQYRHPSWESDGREAGTTSKDSVDTNARFAPPATELARHEKPQ